MTGRERSGPSADDPGQRSRSDPVPQPHAPEDVVADLHALLAAADVPGPYVLAGHSLGGVYAPGCTPPPTPTRWPGWC